MDRSTGVVVLATVDGKLCILDRTAGNGNPLPFAESPRKSEVVERELPGIFIMAISEISIRGVKFSISLKSKSKGLKMLGVEGEQSKYGLPLNGLPA